MNNLRDFRIGLEALLPCRHSRPFVCSGSPLECRSFIVGLNAATRLPHTFLSYWSDTAGFDRAKFDRDYQSQRSRSGNRPRIEAVASEIQPCLETNIYAAPTKRARQLTKQDRQNPIIDYLFHAIKPDLVFVHSNEPISYFENKTNCRDFTSKISRVSWQGHDFWLFGVSGPLFTVSLQKATSYGAQLAKRRRCAAAFEHADVGACVDFQEGPDG